MADGVQDGWAPRLIADMADNYRTYLAYYAATPHGEMHSDAETTRIMTGIPHGYMNAVVHAQMDAPETSTSGMYARIEQVLTPFHERLLPMSWWVPPSGMRTRLERHLEELGLKRDQALCMSLDLRALPGDPHLPEGLTFEPIEHKEALQEWLTTLDRARAWKRRDVAPAWYTIYSSLGFAPDRSLRLYVARLHGKPVATAEVFLAEGIASIRWVTVVPEAPRQATGLAVTRAALVEARSQGYRIATVHASIQGLPLYHRLGFEPCGTVTPYYWMPAQQT